MNPRWTSRKFLTTLAAQVAAMIVLFYPDRRDAIAEAAQTITALIVLLLGALGYTSAEASIDRVNRRPRAKKP